MPFTDKTFVVASEHVLKLVSDMRAAVNGCRSTLIVEMQGDEGAADCLVWRNASKEYKRQAQLLDDEMRELILLAKVAKRILKAVIRVCMRGSRQAMYAEAAESLQMQLLLQSAMVNPMQVSEDDVVEREVRSKRRLALKNSKWATSGSIVGSFKKKFSFKSIKWMSSSRNSSTHS